MGNHESKKAFLFKTFQRKSSTVNIDRDQKLSDNIKNFNSHLGAVLQLCKKFSWNSPDKTLIEKGY